MKSFFALVCLLAVVAVSHAVPSGWGGYGYGAPVAVVRPVLRGPLVGGLGWGGGYGRGWGGYGQGWGGYGHGRGWGGYGLARSGWGGSGSWGNSGSWGGRGWGGRGWGLGGHSWGGLWH